MASGADTGIYDSDYGSDFDNVDETALHTLLDAIEVANAELLLTDKPEGDERPAVARIPIRSQCTPTHSPGFGPPRASANAAHHEQQPPGVGEISIAQDDSPGQFKFETEPVGSQDKNDARSPLMRFRTAPKKPLSVTDLVSPAWCELQYWYSLTKYGRVKRTAAMKRGSEVHKTLEEQVHTTVPVDVQTREDMWGLRIWNVIQGLRTLRVTGMTRELEVWGLLEGKEVINGVLDELSYTCTDQGLEEKIEVVERQGRKEQKRPSDQATIKQFFGRQSRDTLEERVGALENRMGRLEESVAGGPKMSPQELNRKVYLTDVKTRASNTLPNSTAMRPTHMQLMMYRKLLVEMATQSVNADVVFQRYRVDATRPFSDSLIAQLSSLDDNFTSQTGEKDEAVLESNRDTVTELLAHNCLHRLWSLMMMEFQQTMPKGAESISKVLKTEFRSSKDGSVVGVKTFPHLDDQIDNHITEEMKWWRGEREAKGVDVEEAFKCRICEFAEGCSWRATKVEAAVRASRAKAMAKKVKTVVE